MTIAGLGPTTSRAGALSRPALVPAGADDRRHHRHDNHGGVKYDGGGIGTADYDGHAYDRDGGHAGDDHNYDLHGCHATPATVQFPLSGASHVRFEAQGRAARAAARGAVAASQVARSQIDHEGSWRPDWGFGGAAYCLCAVLP
jgi:hypothetical protein